MSADEILQAKIISIAQILLRDEPEETRSSASGIAKTLQSIVRNFGFETDRYDEAAAVAELVRRFSQWVPDDSALSDPTGHDDWLTGLTPIPRTVIDLILKRRSSAP